MRPLRPLALLLAVLAPACTDDLPTITTTTDAAPVADAMQDGAPQDGASQDGASQDDASVTPTDGAVPMPVSTAHCAYEPLPPTARAGAMVESGALRAGAAEALLDLPVGSMLGAYTARGRAYGGDRVQVDARAWSYSGGFIPSVGYERTPRVRAVALSAGGETVVFVKADLGAADDSTTVDVAARLGPSFAGKVVFATSHSHSAWGHHVANEVLGLGFGAPRMETRQRLVDALAGVARRALADMTDARIGIAHDGNFDPMDLVNHDRRGENDDLPNGMHRKDRDLFVVRVDRMDGTPIAVMPVFGVHGTVLGDDNNLASGDAPGAIEWRVEESFDRPVVVMHLQGAGGDVSPSGSGGVNCTGQRVCYNYARVESVGHHAVTPIRAAWEEAGMHMTDRVEMEMVTKAVPLGPDWRTFSIRNGALTYAPFDTERECDGMVFADAMRRMVLSPIDEFNAPYGAGLCGDPSRSAIPSSALMPGTFSIPAYRSCSRVEGVAPFLGPLFELNVPTMPCGATRSLVSALRLNDYVFATLPGEPVTLLVDRLRAASPVAPDHTVVIGYSQGHVGYILHPEDWLRGGYEPSINLWGPLEGEYLMERVLELARLTMTPMRDNAAMGSTLWRMPTVAPQPLPDPAPRAGTVPSTIPMTMYFPSVNRGAMRPERAQPDAMVARLGLARFTWIGEDPRAGTPRITLQREMTMSRGDFRAVTRYSGRVVQDGDLLTAWTPDPIDNANVPRTHYWTVEWQAAPPVGSAYPEDLSARPGVPIGRYRFHVEGTGYSLDSDPFTVTTATLSVTATRSGTSLQVGVGYESRTGWRLLDLSTDSNRLVPLREGAVTVNLSLMGGMTRTLPMQRTDAMGRVTVPDAAMVTRVTVIDRHGNTGTATP